MISSCRALNCVAAASLPVGGVNAFNNGVDLSTKAWKCGNFDKCSDARGRSTTKLPSKASTVVVSLNCKISNVKRCAYLLRVEQYSRNDG